jgi:hypothetical protein
MFTVPHISPLSKWRQKPVLPTHTQSSREDPLTNVTIDVFPPAVCALDLYGPNVGQNEDKPERMSLALSETSTAWSEDIKMRPKWQVALFSVALAALLVGVGIVLGVVINLLVEYGKVMSKLKKHG